MRMCVLVCSCHFHIENGVYRHCCGCCGIAALFVELHVRQGSADVSATDPAVGAEFQAGLHMSKDGFHQHVLVNVDHWC